eukprot:IDg17801t1
MRKMNAEDEDDEDEDGESRAAFSDRRESRTPKRTRFSFMPIYSLSMTRCACQHVILVSGQLNGASWHGGAVGVADRDQKNEIALDANLTSLLRARNMNF